MRDRIEELGKVGIDHIGVAPADQPVHFLDSARCAPPRTIAISIFFQVRFEDGFKDKLGGCLYHPVPDCRDVEWPFSTPGLRDHRPAHRRCLVRLRREVHPQVRQPRLQPRRLDHRELYSVHPRCPAVRASQSVCVEKNVSPRNLIVEQIESSGKMGWAVAEAARDRGALVTLVAGPVDLPDPYGIRVLRVRSTAEMRDIIVPECKDADAVVMAAAVADYQAADPSGKKLKRDGISGLTLKLTNTPDVLSEIQARPGFVRVGFAAESNDLIANAKHKLQAKGLDLIVANDITAKDAGFGVDTNRVVLIDKKRQGRTAADDEIRGSVAYT